MVTLFRRIREKLIQSGSLTKYIIYAVGEILLVVVGILIALQVNNWNEERNAAIFEEEILFLIDQNLERDSVRLSEELYKARQAIELTDRLLEQVELKNYSDSLNYWMGKIISFERFKSQSSAFEVLKARGIETVTDKELQLALISYYDENMYAVSQSLLDIEKSFNDDWIPVIKEDFADFKWRDYHQPVNAKKFFERPSTIVLFKIFQDNREAGMINLEEAITKITEIRSMIKAQLM
ncbi:DUF6090 family protein [Balneola sp. MJW-20]|uniref:DUF6090 family protein n=1 Tax=Gracilimonas aurantiaca TaxID=3234185 RepID=UPI003465ED86